MHEVDDIALLRQYTEQNSEEAFAALVARHIGRVYSVALRRTGNPHQAEEITQAVFVILARKSRHLGRHVILEGWLYQATRLTAVTFIRSEIRRARREQEAHMQTVLNENESDVWMQIAPLLDTALAGLNETDRHAVVLRFFYGKSMKEIGAVLGGSEDAAKMRLNRAVEKLQKIFFKRGIASTTETLAEAISANSVQVAPVALAKSVTVVAIAKGAAASGSTLTLIKGALKLMAWTKMKTAIVAGVIVLLATGTATMVVTKMESSSLDTYLRDPELNDISNAPLMVAIQPTHFRGFNEKTGGIAGKTEGTKEVGRNIFLSTAILKAYRFPSFRRLICPEEVNRTRVDYLVTVPDHPYEKFQAGIKRKFGYTAHIETREMDVLRLRVKRPDAPGLTPADNSPWPEWSARHPQKFGIHYHNLTVSNFAELIERLVTKPVIDGTGLTGNYDFITGSFDQNEINQVFMDQLGLEFVPSREPTEVLVVEKVK
jgi:uncharacterized protein (TIGR03435 family)